MDINSRPWAREEQTELPEPIKVRFTGRLRDRINERQADYVNAYSDNEPDPDTEVYVVSQWRCFSRQKTNVVIETEEEAYSFLACIDWYATPGVSWMNGPMLKAAQRVYREVKNRLDEMGVEIDRP